MKANLHIRRSTGFTLIEMLVTITIVVILAGLSLGGFKFVSSKQANEQARIQIKLLERGLEEYKLDNGTFPTTSSTNDLFKALYFEGASTTPPGKIYISDLDPTNNKQGWTEGTGAGTKIVDPWGAEYIFRSPGQKNPDFDLISKGPDGTVGTPDDISNF